MRMVKIRWVRFWNLIINGDKIKLNYMQLLKSAVLNLTYDYKSDVVTEIPVI